MSDVFISYAGKDAEWASALASRFEARGWSVFWDRTLFAGDEFRRVIEDELAACCALVVLWSRDSVRSHWVLDEARVGLERGVLVPASIDDSELPLGFGQIQSLRLLPPRNDHAADALNALEDSISRLVHGNRSPPAPPRVAAPVRHGNQALLAAGALAVFIAAGFWLTPARGGYLFFNDGPASAGWTSLGLVLMVPGFVLGPRLAGFRHPWRLSIKAMGAASVVAAALLLLLSLLGLFNERQSMAYLVGVWVGVVLALPVVHKRQWVGRFAVLGGAVLGATFSGAFFIRPIVGGIYLDLAAWFVAVLVPIAIVVSDWVLNDQGGRPGLLV